MIQTRQLRKEYHMGESVVHALDGVDLTIESGEFVSLIGASGSGKSTLMHILGCLDRPTSGTLNFRGRDVGSLSEKKLAEIRNREIGFVFQTFNLINRTSALDNVMVPLVYTRKPVIKSRALEALDQVGLTGRTKHTPSEMSGGECQRVAIARAIVNKPQLVLADEPTGNLDSRTGKQIMEIFDALNAGGITIILVTHETEVAVRANRIIRMRDGKVTEDKQVTAEHRAHVLASADATDVHRSSERGSPPHHCDDLGTKSQPVHEGQ